MKKLIAVMALAGMFAVGCASNKGGTSDSNYNSTDTGKMQDSTTQPSQSTTSTNSSTSSSSGQQP
jgi:uncharacterized protein YcfL